MNYRQAIVWQKAMRLAEGACRAVTRMPARERFTMGAQITRASISVATNIAEGWARDSLKEKARFLSIAQGSLDELNTQLLLCDRLGWIDHASIATMSDLADEIGRMLTRLRNRFKQRALLVPSN